MSKWHARYHRAALDGMQSLTLEERGAYNTILDLIYDRQAPLPDDPRWLAGWMGCSLRKWATVRATLIVKGKLYVTADGRLDSLDVDLSRLSSARRVPPGWDATRVRIFNRDGWRCRYCSVATDAPDCDHIIPVSRGGADTDDNLVTACVSCNRSKGDMTPDEWGMFVLPIGATL